MKIAIVTKPLNASPKVLAECLHRLLQDSGYSSDLFFGIDVFKRLLKYDNIKGKYNFISWAAYKLSHYFSDKRFIKKLKAYDAVIIVETAPYGYLKDSYDFKKGKNLLPDIPFLYHGVYFLGNAPTVVEYLSKNNHTASDIFDWHLAVSEVTEVRQKPQAPWSQVGMYLKGLGLKPQAKERLFAVVDFAREGHEEIRDSQIKTLEALNIPYIALSGKYSTSEIREIYKKATFYFIQFAESFGLPIAECLSYGSYIFTPDSSWAMAWRLNESPQIHGPGELADCFVVYKGEKDLRTQLEHLRDEYDLVETPKKVFSVFYEHYPTYYDGNKAAIEDVIKKIKNKELRPTN